MSLRNLPAGELARIDAICLDYESSYRRGNPPDVADLVAQHGGENAELLRRELELVREELQSTVTNPPPARAVAAAGVERAEAAEQRSDYFGAETLPDPGTELGPYVVGNTLGRGGMGVVLQAIDRRLDRKVAIKILAVEIAKRRDLTERFQREARAVAAISHPNIVELFDVGSFDGLPYAVMEYLDGELLSTRLEQGAIDAGEVRRIGAQIADALATAHDAGVIHRDLKPHNIMLVPRSGGEIRPSSFEPELEPDSTIVKLFDFGLSRVPQDGWGAGAEESQQGVIMGTPGYMAPEQALGKSVTSAADIFSLGCILFELLYGRRAFDGPTKIRRHQATLNRVPEPDPTRRRDDIELADLIDRCLEKEPGRRPQSAAQIAQQLRRRDDDTGRITRRRLLELVGGGAAGAVVGTIMLRIASGELQNIRSIAVLSFTDHATSNDLDITGVASGQAISPPPPIGEADLNRGEMLAALLVYELTRLSEINVPRFRPMVAKTGSELREIGAMLNVDALLTGDVRSAMIGSREFLELDIQIVSAKTGITLWGKKFVKDSGDSLLQQSEFATYIASAIGQRLTSTHAEPAPPSVKSFSCLIDGKARSDPDSLPGLEKALMCFQKAHEEDPTFADAVAGIALTSITLAAEADTERSRELIEQAREKAMEARQLDPYSIDARLAEAMLHWQTTSRFGQAEKTFQELAMVAQNNWQVHHQYGLLQLATGRLDEAARSLQEASQLNPLSVTVKVDRARAYWFGGDPERAIQDALRIRDKHEDSGHARGLLVDVYEDLAQYDQAASLHMAFNFAADATDEDYFRERRKRLRELPYGPFGEAVNAVILQARTLRGIDDLALAELIDPPMPPMLPLVLAAHPSFESLKSSIRVKEILPPLGQTAL